MKKTRLCIGYTLLFLGSALLWLRCGTAGPAGRPAIAEDRREPAKQMVTLNEIWPPAGGKIYTLRDSADDGTESGGSWYPDGIGRNLNRAGLDLDGSRYTTALIFRVPDLEQGQKIRYARLRIAGRGASWPGRLTLLITGVLEAGAGPFSNEHLPSQAPLTRTTEVWSLRRPMVSGTTNFPHYHSSPNIAGIVNEILADPGWGSEGRNLAFLLAWRPTEEVRASFLSIEDFSSEDMALSPAILEVCTGVGDAFLAKPMLGRPTDHSITINLMNLLDIDVYAEVGSKPGAYTWTTEPMLNRPAREPIEILIDGLEPNTAYYYRLMYRETGEGDYTPGLQGRFRTKRAAGDSFVFTIQADSHIIGAIKQDNVRKARIYQLTLQNVMADKPDFHIDLGDFAQVEHYGGIAGRTLGDAVERYLVQRRFLGELSNSVPFYLVLGNHEGEQGWRTTRGADSIEIWGTLARKQVIPNPFPDEFYSGSQDQTACCGLRENYYAWEWGDALFVVLDPFWYTMTLPHMTGLYPASMDPWDWTLGSDQYEWLYDTLAESTAEWKFIFSHHVTGGVLTGSSGRNPYGRGGIVAASYRVDQRASYEWGGEDSTGAYVFDEKRPGWDHGPIHKIMVDTGVDAFFHGHDHVFVYETLDGIVYQECPVPSSPNYSDGFFSSDCYAGIQRNNSGHVRVTVSPDSVRVDYVRSVLPEDEPLAENGGLIRNGDISYSYTLRK